MNTRIILSAAILMLASVAGGEEFKGGFPSEQQAQASRDDGDDDRASINRTFLQPFFAYNTKSGFGVTIQTESTYDWAADQWTIPIGIFASQVMKLGGQPVQLSAGPRYYAEGPSGAPDWGFRFTLTFLFPE